MPKQETSTFVHLTGGALAGLSNCVVLQPLDLLKTRLQQQPAANAPGPTLRSAFAQVVSTDGYRGLWRGTVPTILRNAPGSALYFTTLSGLRRVMGVNEASENGKHLRNLIAGGTARISVGFILMPISVVKVRYESSHYAYTSVIGAVRAILLKDGVKGLFYGFGSTALRDAPFAGLYVVMYEHGKNLIATNFNVAESPVSSIPAALFAGFAATAITQPFDVLRTKIQLHPEVYKNSWHALRLIMMRSGGYRELFVGMLPRLIRKSMSAAITWTLYEEIVRRASVLTTKPL